MLLGSAGALSCAHSPYRESLREMNADSQVRLAARISEVAGQYEAAMVQFESTGTLLGEMAAAGEPREWDVYRCRDAVQLCQWWTFNLKRCDEALKDLAPAGAGEPSFALSGDGSESTAGAALGELVAEFERVQQMMESVSGQYAAAIAAMEGPPADPSAGAAELPDLDPLREVIAAAVERANALSSAADPGRGGDARGSAKP